MKTKILFLGLFFLLSVVSLQSKDPDPQYLIGGSAGFSYSKTNNQHYSFSYGTDVISQSNNYSVSSLSVSPLFGYFITKSFAYGLGFNFGVTNQSYESSGQSNETYYLFTPFCRNYFSTELFGHIELYAGNSIITQIEPPMYPISSGGKYTSSVFTYGFGIGVGYDIKIANNVYLEPMIEYSYKQYSHTNSQSDFNQSFIFFNIGIITKI